MEPISLKVNRGYSKRALLDKGASFLYFLLAAIASSGILIVGVFLLYKGLKPFFTTYTINGQLFKIDVGSFLFGLSWSSFPAECGVLFLAIDTIWISLLALVIALPLSILLALFITHIAPKALGKSLEFAVELLSAIPSVVYGLFGRGVITQLVKDLATLCGYQSKGGLSTLAGALVLAIMVIPTITSLSSNAMASVDQDLIASSLALGCSKSETNFKIVLRSASSGIFAGVILALGRALGEATAISMVVGNAGSGPTFSLFDITSTLTTTMLLGYSEATGINADIRFSIGLVLIVLIVAIDGLLTLLKKMKDRHDGKI